MCFTHLFSFFFVFVVLFCFVFSFLSFHILGAVLLNPRNHKVYTRQVFSYDYLHEMTGLEDIRQKAKCFMFTLVFSSQTVHECYNNFWKMSFQFFLL